MSDIISDYSELLAAIKALPKPPKGAVRVFRGQTADWPKLEPSGLRKSLRAMSIWKVYSHHLYSALAQRWQEISMQDLQAFGLWFDALAQHYGPGSDFLDVTYSIDIALWFALNESKIVAATGSIGPDGPPNPVLDHQTSMNLVGYEPWQDKNGGYIYVFDLPLWDGEGLAKAGQVVDLAKAPEMFSASPRMRAQSGCLIYCRKDDRTPLDVRGLLVEGTPLRIRRPMKGTTAPDLRVADIYPSPAQDEWFARFLSVPMTYAAQPTPPTLQRSIPVVVYYDKGNQRYLEEVHFHDVAIQPPLAHRVIPELQARSPSNGPATIVLLEAPMVFPYAPADSDQWHHGLLWTDLPDRCPEYEFGSDKPVGEVSLSSVFFELSLLEGVGWEQAIHQKTKIELQRGVWLRRSDKTIEAAILLQNAPDPDVQMLGFFSLFYDPALRRIMVSLPKGPKEAIPIDALDSLGKPIMIALMLLRYLSPMLKCQPTPKLVVDGTKILLGCARDAARLYRVRPSPPNPHWFVLRDANKPEEPFTHVNPDIGALSLETELPFRDFPLDDLQQGLKGLSR
jgi:hypothetical protein